MDNYLPRPLLPERVAILDLDREGLFPLPQVRDAVLPFETRENGEVI